MRRCGILFAATAIACGSDNGTGVRSVPLPNEPAPTDTATVTVTTSSPSPAIPANFLGFSFEVDALKDTELTNPSYAAAASLLGPGVVRFGGNSVDRSSWSPNPPPGDDSDLTGADFDRGITFARNAHWTMYLGINLGSFEPDTFAAEAAYAANRPGAADALTAIEIGNEPDVFTGAYRSSGYDGDSIAREYAAYGAALSARAPNVRRVGPAMCCKPEDFSQFLSDGGGQGLLLLTYHHYPTTAVVHPSVAYLLSPAFIQKSSDIIGTVIGDANAVGMPLRMAESNSASSGGQPGTSDVFAAALWGLDYMYTLAEHGVVGVNFHGDPQTTIYGPLIDSAGIQAKPLFYAMLAFHAGAIGSVVPASIATSANAAVHAALAGDGTLRVTIVNKDTASSILARITPTTTYRSATALFLTAPSVHSGTGVTFAGTSVSTAGAWQAAAPFAIPAANGTFNVPLATGSAAVVTLTR